MKITKKNLLGLVCFFMLFGFFGNASAENFLNEFGDFVGVKALLNAGLTKPERDVKEFAYYCIDSSLALYDENEESVPYSILLRRARGKGRIIETAQVGSVLTVYSETGGVSKFKCLSH